MTITFAAAKKLFDEKKYQQALQVYEELGKLYGQNVVEYNIQLCKEQLNGMGINLCLEEERIATLSQDIFVGIASVPERKEALRQTIMSLIDQTPQIGVYLNNWSEIPEFLQHPKITIAGYKGKDIGDIGKFFWVDNFKGIYFSCDDDLIYPPDYIARSIKKLREHDFNAAISWHGSLLLSPFERYYDKNSRRVFSFASNRPYDTNVHILGTGCCAFHTEKLSVKTKDFLYPNMADIFFAIKGQQEKFPFYVIEHGQNEIREVPDSKEHSIFAHSHANLESKKNTHELQNKYIRENMPWVQNSFSPMRILVIGRFKNFSKGGIYKSCHLIEQYLSLLGHVVYTLDTQEELTSDFFFNKKIDLCWIYPGDPERPDYATVEKKIMLLQDNKIPVLVNLSYLYEKTRSIFIKNTLTRYNTSKQSPVFGAVFTESAAQDPILESVSHLLCVIPKTIFPEECSHIPKFSEREGICLGDATKLGNQKLLGGSVSPWIEAIHKRMPHLNIYAYKQYQGQNPHPIVKYVPHMKGDFGNWLAHRRLFLCLNVFTTFEMVACEAQIYGTPALYRHMPHSLSEYISATGIAVRTPDEMAEMIAWLYNNEGAWNNFSQSSIYNAKSNHIKLLSSSLEAYLRLAIYRAKNV